jgi:isoquinoline 1-oxidoreductase beta subunit
MVINTAAAAGNIDFNSYYLLVLTVLSPYFSQSGVGQNIKTSFPMIVAEELDADWTKVKVIQAPLDTKRFERQVTGGSGAVPHSWKRLRTAGATARQMLIDAAATRWKYRLANSPPKRNGDT